MSKRVYLKKGDAAYSASIKIPITRATDAQIAAAAEKRQVTRTELARTFILLGLATADG